MVFFLYGGLWGLFKGIVYLLLNICSVFFVWFISMSFCFYGVCLIGYSKCSVI